MGRSQDYFSKSSVLQAAWKRGNWEPRDSWAWGWVCMGVLLPVKVSAGCPFLLSSHDSTERWAGTCRSKTSFDTRDFGFLCWQSLW